MTAQTQNKDVSTFRMLFGDIRLEINNGLKVHKPVTEIEGQFMDLYTELSLLIDPIELHQRALAESMYLTVILVLINASFLSLNRSSIV